MWLWKLPILVLIGGFTLFPTPLFGQDLERGEYLFDVCAGCHGLHGQGGGGGVYPRLAGLPRAYLADQLRAFKTRERLNVPMLMFANERELPERDILDLAAYAGSLSLVTRRLPTVADAIAAPAPRAPDLRTVDIPRTPGDLAAGSATYRLACARCHGRDGWGDATVPPLAGQHTRYLARQIDQFTIARRKHPEAMPLFRGRSGAEIRDLLAYLSVLADPAEASAGRQRERP